MSHFTTLKSGKRVCNYIAIFLTIITMSTSTTIHAIAQCGHGDGTKQGDGKVGNCKNVPYSHTKGCNAFWKITTGDYGYICTACENKNMKAACQKGECDTGSQYCHH